jgi:hypothetical protein
MPFYIGEEMPEWGEWDSELGDPAPSAFKYILPTNAGSGSVSFPPEPGAKPIPEPPRQTAPPTSERRSLFDKLLGRRSPRRAPAPRSAKDIFEQLAQEDAAREKLSLWEISQEALALRNMGVRRVFGAYDGGNDESFAHPRGIEMRNGEWISAERAQALLSHERLEALIEHAANVIMGRHDAGPFVLRGALAIDVEACTITDERDSDKEFGA